MENILMEGIKQGVETENILYLLFIIKSLPLVKL